MPAWVSSWFPAPDYWLSRLVLERGLALVYLIAFTATLDQFVPLLGERGLLPVPRLLRVTSWRSTPSLFRLHYSDRALYLAAGLGWALAAAQLAGGPDLGPPWLTMLVWLLLWALYLSIVNVGQVFYSFGWESLLLEAGFLAIFLGSSRVAPPIVTIFIMRWLVFRLEFGAGLIKLRGDRCWRDLTCLYYHHETQPMPNPLSWYFHRLPRPLHKVEVASNHFAQLVVPFALFAPQPAADIAAAVVVVTQSYLLLSGNFAWLNALTIVLATSAMDDTALSHVVPVAPPAHALTDPAWFVALVLTATALVAGLSYWPAHNLVSRRQLMNASFNKLHLVNTYGAFGSVTKVRYEVVLEGTDSDGHWQEYEFKGKPGSLRRRPPQVAPYHLRLDWLMWFAAISPAYAEGWLVALVGKLLAADRGARRLLRRDPFGGQPPGAIRAQLYRYRFTTFGERRRTGQWWVRTYAGQYLPPLRLSRDGRVVGHMER